MSNRDTQKQDDGILEPLSAYKTIYKSAFRRNCEVYFDELVKKSGVDLAENRKTVAAYAEKTRLAEAEERSHSRYACAQALLIVWIVIGCVLLLLSIGSFVKEATMLGAIFAAAGALSVVAAPLLLVYHVRPALRKTAERETALREKAEELLRRAWKQTQPLNALFEDKVTKKLIEKTVPLLQLDDYFNVRRYDFLNGKYGYGADDPETSTIGILTGEIEGNPFVVDRELVHTMGSETYTGSLVISWETSSTDPEGNRVTVHHSQVLTASVTRPKPFYHEETRLVYGNEAAPDLHFSRRPSHAEDMSEGERARKVKRGAKKIRKKQEDALANGGSFTELGNEAFDVLFGALDRDNEVQFRLLFTPLAQKNLLALMTDPEGFGDDFYLRKSGCLNYVISEHSAQWDLDEERERYFSYSVARSREAFLAFNEQYFRSLYFDLAPLLSIPLYQQMKPREYIYRESDPRRFTRQEAEYAVNRMNVRAFAPPSAATRCILKTRFLSRDGESERIGVSAFAYNAYQQTEFVPVFGGDGCMHAVPVDWIEYVPVSSETTVEMKELGLSDREFYGETSSGSLRAAMERFGKIAHGYHHGILCCVVPENEGGFDEAFTIKK